ncbi:MAG: phage portal protein [Gammaproteobacteria bacterium]|nr:phage portal protein [Gammaproteobacteria bacterium]
MPITKTESGLAVYKRWSQPEAQKGTTLSSSFEQALSGSRAGTLAEAKDYPHSRWGAAMAYLTVHAVFRCVQILVNGVSQLDWNIVRVNPNEEEDDLVLASSKDDIPRHDFHQAMRDFRRDNGMGLLPTIMFDRTLYGTVFFERIGGFFVQRELEWLNPLGITIQTMGNRIDHYRYGWSQQYVTIEPERVAYNRVRHPLDDFDGYSPVMAVMRKVNLENSFNQFLNDFFSNGATPSTIFMPTDETGVDAQTLGKIESSLRQFFQGLGNQFRSVVFPKRLEMQQLGLPDLRQFELERDVNTQIFEGMGVPQAMAGNTSATPYKDGDETTRFFWLNAIIPESKEIQSYINAEFMPFFDPSGKTRFKYDYSPFDTITNADKLEADTIAIQVSGGYVSLATAARTQERPVENWMEGRYMIEGVPMTEAQINEYAQAKIEALKAQSQPMFGELSTPSLPALPEQMASEEDATIIDMIDDDEDVDEGTTEWETHHPFLRLYDGECLYPDEDTIQTRINHEMAQWRKFELSHCGEETEPFVHYVTPIYLRHAIFDRMPVGATEEQIKAAFSDVRRALRTDGSVLKSISTYRRRLRALATQLWNSAIGLEAFETGMNQIIRTQLTLAFEEGVKRGGKTMDELTGDERAKLNAVIKEELSHVRTIGKAIRDNNKASGGKLAPIRARVDLWVSRWSGIADYGFAIAGKDKKMKWVWDARKEHCHDCARFNGRVYRGSTWANRIGIYPRSSKLACFGGFCGCNLIATDDPITRGRKPRI